MFSLSDLVEHTGVHLFPINMYMFIYIHSVCVHLIFFIEQLQIPSISIGLDGIKKYEFTQVPSVISSSPGAKF